MADLTPQRSTLQRIVSGSSIYSVAIIVGRLSGIILLPVYTRYLSTAEYGTLELFELTLYVLSSLIGLKIADVITYFYSNAEQFHVERHVVLSTAFFCSFLLGLILSAAGCIGATPLMTLVVGDPSTANLFRLMVISYALGLPTEVAMGYFRVIDSAGTAVAFSLGRLFIAGVVNVYLLVVWKMGMAGMVWGSLISSMIMVTGLLIACAGRQHFRISFDLLTRMIKYGAPLGIGGLAILTIHYGDRAFLRQYAGLNDIGIYSLGYKLGMLITYVQMPFETYWRSQMYTIMKQSDGEKTYIRAATYLTVGASYCALGLTVFSVPVLTLAVGPGFRTAAVYVSWVALAYAVRTVATHFCSIFLIEGQTYRETLVTWIAALSCFVGYVVLIPRFTMWGAIAATNIAFLTMLIVAYIQGQRVRYFPFELQRIAHSVGLAVLLATGYRFLPNTTTVEQFQAACAISIAYPLMLWLTGFAMPDERAFIARQIKKVTRRLPARAITSVTSSTVADRVPDPISDSSHDCLTVAPVDPTIAVTEPPLHNEI